MKIRINRIIENVTVVMRFIIIEYTKKVFFNLSFFDITAHNLFQRCCTEYSMVVARADR